MGIGNNQIRFLRYLLQFTENELVFSKILPQWERTTEGQAAARWIKKRKLWPSEKCELVYLVQTLEKIHKYPINTKTLRLARKIQKQYRGTLDQYITIRRQSKMVYRWENAEPIIKHTAEEAYIEQKARGYIPVHEFEELDIRYRHCFSIVNREYIYPYNFSWGAMPGTHIIRGLGLVGVSGYTRITQ